MFKDKKVAVVMPAYNAEQALRITYEEVMEQGLVDVVIVVDDGSHDDTVRIARELPHRKRAYTRMSRTVVMALTKKHVISSRSRKERISWLWSILITSIRRS